jgi:hypothetical protein
LTYADWQVINENGNIFLLDTRSNLWF